MLNPLVNGKIQRLFKAFECFSSTFQGKFNFQGLFKTNLYIQVLFKPVQTLSNYSLLFKHIQLREQWLSARVLYSRSRGCRFEPHKRHCIISLNKTLYPLWVYLNTAKTPKLRKDTQRHAKTHKDGQRRAKTHKDGKKTFEVDKTHKDRQRYTKMANGCLKLSKTPKDRQRHAKTAK